MAAVVLSEWKIPDGVLCWEMVSPSSPRIEKSFQTIQAFSGDLMEVILQG